MNQTDTNELFDKVTEKQRECLRLVARAMKSKDIAPILGIAHTSVDKRVERAMAIMKITDRGQAARMLVDHENRTNLGQSATGGTLVGEFSDLPSNRSRHEHCPSSGEMSPALDGGSIIARAPAYEDETLLDHLKHAAKQPPFSALFEVERENRQSIWVRALIIILIIFGSFASMSIALAVINGSSELVKKVFL